MLLNLAPEAAEISFDIANVCWSAHGSELCSDFFDEASIRDLWAQQDLGVDKKLMAKLGPDGDSRMFKVVPRKPLRLRELLGRAVRGIKAVRPVGL